MSYPIYRVNQSIKVKSNEKVAITGLYISEFAVQCSAVQCSALHCTEPNRTEPNRIEFMAHSNEDDRGFGSVIPTIMDPETYYEETDWYLIGGVANEGGSSLPIEAEIIRVVAGQTCPKSGLWWSPVNQSRSRYFEKGEILPKIENNE